MLCGIEDNHWTWYLTPVLVVTLAFLAFSPTICWTDIYRRITQRINTQE